MGLLILGQPLDWENSQEHIKYVKDRGIEQFLQLYQHYAHKTDAPFKWGDEVEYFICAMDEDSKTARLPLRAPEILKKLEEFKHNPGGNGAEEIIWHPEYANWMLEATPGHPYGSGIEDLLDVERNMILRRKFITSYLKPSEELFSMTCFPRMGTPNFTLPNLPVNAHEDGVSNSIYIPDEAINPHPRFPALTANIRKRRGEKVAISVPIYKDRHTDKTLQRQADHAVAMGAPLPATVPAESIYMDAMSFGMGSGCLQVTMQAKDIHEARLLYDQLAVVAPLFLALTASSPVWKGMLADTDVRWAVIRRGDQDRARRLVTRA